MLVILAAANTTFIAWATVVDARQSSALAHAFGAPPRQVSAGLSAAQLLPALPGTIVGIPAGIYLYRAVTHDQLTVPRPGSYSPAGTLLVVTGLTAIPASAPAAPSRDPASRVITGAANRRRDSPLICRDTDGDSGGRKSRPIDRSGTLT